MGRPTSRSAGGLRPPLIGNTLGVFKNMTARDAIPVFISGLAFGALGGLIGLGGAEFRLPLLISVFGCSALPAVMINKTTSLVIVASSLPLRAGTIPFSQVSQVFTPDAASARQL